MLRDHPLGAAFAGLAHFRRKLCEEQSVSTVDQLLSLGRPQLDMLLDALKPLPGHRTRLLHFIQEKRAERAAASSERRRGGGGAGATADQRRKWASTRDVLERASVAGQRGRDAPFAHANTGLPPARSRALVSSVRILRVGNARVLAYDGPTPNSPRAPSHAGSVRRFGAATAVHPHDPDLF